MNNDQKNVGTDKPEEEEQRCEEECDYVLVVVI